MDQISTYRKITLFERPGERVMVAMCAGNLALSQAVIGLLREQETAGQPGWWNAASMLEATRHVGDALREIHRRDAAALKEHNIEFNVSMIFGGQIGTEPPRLFCVYAAGNFIEATADTPYFQIGESKYGKPIIDRVLRRTSSLNEAVKCALVSMDSTIRSNLSVGLPLDLVIVRRDRFSVARHMSIDADNEYFRGVRTRWSEALREAFTQLPEPDFLRATVRDLAD